jgi:hypothetical protein
MKREIYLLLTILLCASLSLNASSLLNSLSGGGSGTQSDPYKIKTTADVLKVRDAINMASGNVNSAADAYYELANDIDMIGIEWANTIGNSANCFKGSFDGKGFKIDNLCLGSLNVPNATTSSVGLFGCIENAKISNLELDVEFFFSGSSIRSDSLTCGALVATIQSGSNLIDKCNVHGVIYSSLNSIDVNSNNISIGGLIGRNDFRKYGKTSTKVINCSADINITGRINTNQTSDVFNCGGIIGENSSEAGLSIVNCYTLGLIDLDCDNYIANVGGVIGNNSNITSNCEIANCYAANNLDVTGNALTNVGGIAGCFTSYEGNKVSNCTALNTIIYGKTKGLLSPSVNRIIGFSGLNTTYEWPSLPIQPDLMVKAMSVNYSPVYVREGNEFELSALVFNTGLKSELVTVSILLPDNVELLAGKISFKTLIPAMDSTTSVYKWKIRPKQKGKMNYEIRIENGVSFTKSEYSVEIREPYVITNEDYVPPPNPISSGDYLLGAFRCPLWYEKTRPGCWDIIAKNYPERAPVLGYYNEALPEVVDWDIKYAIEHGISFFMDCWYRTPSNLGKSPIVAYIDHWLTAYLNSKYKEQMNFALLWVNVIKTNSTGISSESDLIDNLLPYWIDNYFKKSSYLKIDNKPVLSIYSYAQFITDLGGNANAKLAVQKMKEACVAAGFSGLHLITTHQSNYNNDISYLKELGFDAITSYHVPTFTGKMNSYNPPEQSVIPNIQETCWNEIKRISKMETYPVACMGWDDRPWKPYGAPKGWFLEPSYFKTVCEKAKSFSDNNTGIKKIIMLDNWNEFGEGHYIAPSQQFGFSYLDVIREVFTINSPHIDLTPQDIGRDSYRYPFGETF